MSKIGITGFRMLPEKRNCVVKLDEVANVCY